MAPPAPALPPLSLGTARLGAVWQRRGLRAGADTVRAALDAGIGLIDTADVYARGLSERVVGRAVRGRRDEVLVCTKVGQVKTPLAALTAAGAQGGGRRPALRDLVPARTPGDVGTVPKCFESAYVLQAAHRSLRRLGTDRIDVLLLHSPTAADLAAGRFAPALDRLVTSGDVGAVGVSCETPDVAVALLGLEWVSWVELPWSVLSPESTRSTIAALSGRGVAVLAGAPFAAGRVPGLVGPDGHLDARVAGVCLRHATTTPGVASVVVGMSDPAHVRSTAALLDEALPQDEHDRVVAELRATGASSA